MPLHESTFKYLKPTDKQLVVMERVRQETQTYALALENLLPDGPDKTFIMRSLRTLGMWCNVALTRTAEGAPRDD